jgi:hypothetical protein
MPVELYFHDDNPTTYLNADMVAHYGGNGADPHVEVISFAAGMPSGEAVIIAPTIVDLNFDGGVYSFTVSGAIADGSPHAGEQMTITFSYTDNIPSMVDIEVTIGTDAPFNATLNVNNAHEISVCYAQGTLIRTERGDVPVEELKAGDLAVTASGELKPIRWLGHRDIDCRRHPNPASAWPVRISAHALGPRRPERDLYVSPGHAICLDLLGEVLIPACALVNGATIAQDEVETVSYWHVELDEHDILIAENQPAESYLDMGNRGFFIENGVVSAAAYPDGVEPWTRTHADFCRPFHWDGPLVLAARAQLRARAKTQGWTLDEEPPLDLHLVVDGTPIEPVIRGRACRFAIPAGAQEACLISSVIRPCDVSDNGDARTLGVCVVGLTLYDGFEAERAIDLSDPQLDENGFHGHEEGVGRWTSGRASIPGRYLREGVDGMFLRVDLGEPVLARWTAPEREVALAARYG